MKRPVIYPHEDCLEHWMTVPCIGCYYDGYPERSPYTWPIQKVLRAVYHRLFARIEYRPVES